VKFSEAVRALSDAGIENARGEVRIMFEELCSSPRRDLSIGDPESPLVDEAVRRRILREPLQYIIGKTYFYNEEYFTSPDCLIPRSDTEILVECAVKNLSDGARFIDLCTGSGCVAVSTLKNTKNTSAVAVDISEGALKMAKKNAMHNGVSDRIDFVLSDALSYDTYEEFDALLCNPPYIDESVYSTLEKEIFHEPKIALVADDFGLLFYKTIIPRYKNKIKRGGFMAFEIGYDQGDALMSIARENGLLSKIIKDYSSNDRVAFIKM
jgi:release factor glutamine methyltransferase